MSIRVEDRRFGTIGLTDGRPALSRPVRDSLSSAVSGVLAWITDRPGGGGAGISGSTSHE